MKKHAFTLIELLIVIIIMGVIYTLAINNFSALSDKSAKLTMKNLKEYLLSSQYDKSARLLCLDNCQECALYIDGNKTKDIEKFLDAPVRTYRYETNSGYIQASKELGLA